MTDDNKNSAVQKKKELLKEVRDAFYGVGNGVSNYLKAKRLWAFRVTKLPIFLTQEERKEQEFCEEFKEREIPKQFRDANPDDFKWTSPSFMLASFQKMLMFVRDPDARLRIIENLKKVATNNTGDESVGYVRRRLEYDIYRGVTNRPYTFPKYVEFVTIQDVIKQNFLGLIHKGIRAYERAPQETQEKFNQAVMPRVKKNKVVGPLHVEQKRHDR